ncbi:hypothetical protein KNP414_07932 [Paenibacillus mucilaginosus KNP414]|uniref:Uncharacterized protein n=1 Tax=Paenibacillus mucilaginosus (strain KNP414) TaxID=1036673 RepID=F8FKP9_PAEMK|nr:hypothetical protein KNP414_07932 [Paenibacillus mucilaginosus KNP414]
MLSCKRVLFHCLPLAFFIKKLLHHIGKTGKFDPIPVVFNSCYIKRFYYYNPFHL